MAKQMIFSQDAREGLLEGVSKLSRAVKVYVDVKAF